MWKNKETILHFIASGCVLWPSSSSSSSKQHRRQLFPPMMDGETQKIRAIRNVNTHTPTPKCHFHADRGRFLSMYVWLVLHGTNIHASDLAIRVYQRREIQSALVKSHRNHSHCRWYRWNYSCCVFFVRSFESISSLLDGGSLHIIFESIQCAYSLTHFIVIASRRLCKCVCVVFRVIIIIFEKQKLHER